MRLRREGDPTRREFVCGILGGLPLLESCAFPPAVAGGGGAGYQAVFDVSGLTADGESLATATPGADRARILIVRRAPNRFLAMSMLCPHEGCPVQPPVNGLITCPCHGSQFDLEGKVRRGPARFPLARYATSYEASSRTLRVTSR